MIKLILGRAGSGKTTKILQRLCQAGEKRPQLLLVPEQQSHETERALCQMGGNSVSLFAEVLSFSRMGDRILSQLGGIAHQELDAGGRILLMHSAVKAVSSQLSVYARPSRRPAFLQSLLSTADELKSCCVPPEQLMVAGEELEGSEGEKLHDLGLILGTYQALTARIALDPRDRLTRVGEKLRGSGWAKGKDLWLDGFTDFTPQEHEILLCLMSQAENTTITLTCDKLEEDEDGTGIFSPARKTAATLIRLAKDAGKACEVEILYNEQRGKEKPLIHVEQTLFSYDAVEPAKCEDAVEIFSALTPRSEVEWTASRIRSLVQSGEYRYRDIGVVARNYGVYQDLVESVFLRYEVPVFSSAMTDILEKPVLALVTAALETVVGGYTYDDLFRYLKTGLTDLPENDRDILENYALKWNLRGSQWTQKKDWTMHPRGYGFSLEESDRSLLERLNALRRQVVQPLENLRRNKSRSGVGQAVSLYSFLEEIGLPTRLEERVALLHQGDQPALAEEYRQLWDILCSGLEQCATLLGEEELELEEFAQLFRLVLSQYDVGTIPVSLDRVTAGETTRQTGHRVKVLFLLGADDASIPRVGDTPGLLSDDDRSLLASYGLELNQTTRDLLYREMTTVYLTCARPANKLVVTWPSQGTGGEDCRPSFLVERFRLMFSDLSVIHEESLDGVFRLNAPVPALEQAGRDRALAQALGQMPQYARQVARLDQAARWSRGKLSRPAVDKLYGQKVSMSASRMDQYKSCHFSYFMRYGLKAEPRKPAGFTAPEYGTFVHYVLEEVLKNTTWRTDGDDGTSTVDNDVLSTLTEQAVERYIAEELGGMEHQTERFRYLFRRLLRSVHAVVNNVAQELASSQFKPISFELGFGRQGDLPPVEFTVNDVTLSVTGFVDRVDGWVSNGRLYLRVVDYKTGRKSFDLTEVFNGLGLQMLLYLFTLEDKGESLYGLPVEGAGVLYLPARDAIIKGSRSMSDEAWEKAVNKELTRSGLVLDNEEVLAAMEQPGENGYRFLPLKVGKKTGGISGDALVTAERLGKLGRHIETVLGDICDELAQGNISADPFWRGDEKNACKYCDYSAACHFEEGRGGDCRRWMQKLKPDEFWTQLEEKAEELK